MPELAPARTVADLLVARRDDEAVGLRFEDTTWSWAQVVMESTRRAQLAEELLGAPEASASASGHGGPRHLGVLLDNVPEYLFWLGAAALSRATVVGINPTRPDEELAGDIRFTRCRALVADERGAVRLGALDTGVSPERLLVVGDASSVSSVPSRAAAAIADPPRPEDLLLLLFTSGTTGAPKAVRCSQGRLASIALRAAELYDFRRDDVCYCPMPLFHGNALMALWAPALAAGAGVALDRRFSASRFLAEVRHHRATRFTYVGKALAYVLATPEQPDDADNTLRIGFGTEASAPDRLAFERRFGCRLVEGYGSSEGGISINVTPETPPGALGRAATGEDVAVCGPDGTERPRARLDRSGRLLNADEAIGEIVNRSGARGFEGYYDNAEADDERTRAGWYWSGDLGYRDEAGFFYFAGRAGDWLRVDSENFAAAPVERVLERHPDVAAAAVYPVPDPVSGDRVMATLELRPGGRFDPDAFAQWLLGQPDLGAKWAPRLVRITAQMPLTATGKIRKPVLRAEAWECDEPVWHCPGRELNYRPLTDDDRRTLRNELDVRLRTDLLETATGGRRPGQPTKGQGALD
jgi:fatty-acyl-CoA synthase